MSARGHNDWATLSLPPRRLAAVDVWHGGRVDVRHFERERGGPSLRLILELDLKRAEVEQLLAQVLDAIYAEDEE
jgi:hypothetical protein